MLSPNAIADIYHRLLTTNTDVNKHHFLFLFGTHGKLIPKPTLLEKHYTRGETLSYALLRVASQLGETENLSIKTPGDSLSFCTSSVEALNGPTTRGTEVGELIAEALFLVLRAAASGKETLQISAHSRGAVEAILLMHELGRIKLALAETPEKSLKQILLDSPCKLTRAAIIKLFINNAEEDTTENRALLYHRLNALTINAFLIDPVPGDSTYAFAGFNWYDERFYQKPPCNSYVLLLCRDEFSSFFYPIVSKGMQFYVIPGHHGSPLGNLFTQAYLELPENLRHLKTTDVQDLVLCKLLYFLHQTTNIFPPQESQLDFGHTALDSLANSFLEGDDNQKKLFLLNLYVEVAKNDSAYRYFTNTHYPYLPRAFAPGNYRYVHLYGHEFKSMPDIQSDFVNPEHALLYLGKYVNFSETHETEADVQVSAITCTLKNIILEMKGVSAQRPLLTIISSEPGREIFFNSLSMLVGTISQKYLHDHLSIEEKKRLKTVITLPFITLSEAKEEIELSGHKDTIDKCHVILQDGFKHTAEVHYDSIVQQANQLQQQIRLFIAPSTDFSTTFVEYLGELAIEDELGSLLITIKERLNGLDPVNVFTTQQAFIREQEQIQQNDQIDSTQMKQLNTALFSRKYIKLQAYFEAHQYDVDYYLSKIEQICSAVEELSQLYPQLKSIIGAKNLEIDQEQLALLNKDLINLAVTMRREKWPDLCATPEIANESVYSIAKQSLTTIDALMPVAETTINTVISQGITHLDRRGNSPVFFGPKSEWVYIDDLELTDESINVIQL